MGLRAFEFEDAALFFGRETQTEGVLARLYEVRFVAVVGASGSGKSSFVRTGLVAAIRAASKVDNKPRVVVLTPGEHPLDQLAGAIVDDEGDGGARVLAYKLLDAAQQRWRRFNGHELIADVLDGAVLVCVSLNATDRGFD